MASDNCLQFIGNSSYERPNDDTIIWRYMDLSKLMSLLTFGLNFTNPNLFDDPFECAKCTAENFENWKVQEVKLQTNKYVDVLKRTVEENNIPFHDAENLNKALNQMFESIDFNNDDFKKRLLVSCWFEGEEESDAMWKLYSGSYKYGIAIKTTVGKLQKAIDEYFNGERKVDFARVKYVDYTKEHVSINEVAWCKRKAFKHENEIRAMAQYIGEYGKNDYEGINKLYLKLPLHEFVDSIVLAPFSDNMYKDMIDKILKQFGYDIPIKKSQMSEKLII